MRTELPASRGGSGSAARRPRRRIRSTPLCRRAAPTSPGNRPRRSRGCADETPPLYAPRRRRVLRARCRIRSGRRLKRSGVSVRYGMPLSRTFNRPSRFRSRTLPSASLARIASTASAVAAMYSATRCPGVHVPGRAGASVVMTATYTFLRRFRNRASRAPSHSRGPVRALATPGRALSDQAFRRGPPPPIETFSPPPPLRTEQGL